MRSFLTHFSDWIAVALCVLAVETWFERTHYPDIADRSNFVSYGVEDNFFADQLQQILHSKMRMTIDKPDFVQVGDSSGFFGIMPDLVEQYLPGMKYLNSSCCATQGFNGYLALLRFHLRRHPSIKYIVVHAGILGAFPSATQWRGAPATLFTGKLNLKTLGGTMETNLNPPWSWFGLPTNSLRRDVLQHTLLSDQNRKILSSPTEPFEAIISGLQKRQGYGVERDLDQDVGVYGADPYRCIMLRYDTFFDWRSLKQKSYLDAFVEEFVALAKEYDVTPILYFQVSPCTESGMEDLHKMRANLVTLQQRFPRLKVPVDIIDTYPENDFSVLLHVQRDTAEDTSRRLGRALRQIVMPDKPLSVEQPRADAPLSILRATRVDACADASDISAAFREQCDGKTACDVALSAWKQPTPPACKITYVAEYLCGEGPARALRQEGDDRFGGRFRLDCTRHGRWPKDGMPPVIRVYEANSAGKGGNPMGLVTLRAKAFCDGLLACDYTLKNTEDMTDGGDFTVRWYCGARGKITDRAGGNAGNRGQARLQLKTGPICAFSRRYR